MATRAFGIDFATLTASVIVIVACCDRVVLLVSKKTIQAFDGGGGAGGGCRRDMFSVDSPHAVTRRASPIRAERLLNILASKGCCAHCTWTLRNAHQAIRRPGHCGRPRARQPAVLGSSPASPWKDYPRLASRPYRGSISSRCCRATDLCRLCCAGDRSLIVFRTARFQRAHYRAG